LGISGLFILSNQYRIGFIIEFKSPIFSDFRTLFVLYSRIKLKTSFGIDLDYYFLNSIKVWHTDSFWLSSNNSTKFELFESLYCIIRFITANRQILSIGIISIFSVLPICQMASNNSSASARNVRQNFENSNLDNPNGAFPVSRLNSQSRGGSKIAPRQRQRNFNPSDGGLPGVQSRQTAARSNPLVKDKVFQCKETVCNRQFPSTSELLKHLKSSHRDFDPINYPELKLRSCEFCNELFHEHGLHTHYAKMHQTDRNHILELQQQQNPTPQDYDDVNFDDNPINDGSNVNIPGNSPDSELDVVNATPTPYISPYLLQSHTVSDTVNEMIENLHSLKPFPPPHRFQPVRHVSQQAF